MQQQFSEVKCKKMNAGKAAKKTSGLWCSWFFLSDSIKSADMGEMFNQSLCHSVVPCVDVVG